MKTLFLLALSLFSLSGMAKDITLKVDVSRHLENFSSVNLSLTYVSTSTALGCQTYSGDILDPMRPIFIEKNVTLRDGIANEVIPTSLTRCNAKLSSVDLKIRLDRVAVARSQNASKSDVDKNRIDFHFGVFEPRAGEILRDSELRLAKLYVAGSDDLKYTYACSFTAAPIINDSIDLSL